MMRGWTDDDGSAVAAFRRAGTARGRRAAGTVQLEGWRLLERAMAAGVAPSLVIASTAAIARRTGHTARVLRDAERSRAALRRVDDGVMVELVGGRTFGDLVSLAPAPAPPTWREVFGADRPVPLLILADVCDPGNAGALVRTAHGVGVGAVVTVGGADPLHAKAARTSMGSIFRVGVRALPADGGWSEVMVACRAAGVATIGLVTEGGAPLWEVASAGSVAVVVGGEAFGLGADRAAWLDGRATIPMPDGVDSLSVNAAAAIALYEISVRGRWD